FPSIYGGLLPLVVVNTAISLALVKNLLDSLLRIVGLKRDSSEIPSSSLDNPGEIPPSPSSSSSPPSSLEFPGENEEHEAQCAVCLCDFEPSSLVRKLPNCSHVFHRDCLDKWLNHNHTTCPMCRSSL
ncbi:hypothetical protein SELMODRAFT_49554, partial [Selaginella moellendorffii]